MTSTRALLLATAALAHAGTAQAQESEASTTAEAGATAANADPASGVEEIVVTAQKRAENLQAVPISIQVLSTEKLEQLQVTQFSDYIKYLPSVSFTSLGPGFSQAFFRGVASGEGTNHSASLPTVGTYLDEQPITTIQGALDIHIYDIARVETLSGPQGTLYGASAEAGVIRIISNRPQFGRTEGSVDLEINTTAHGEIGYVGEGFINLPLAENAAIRLVGWYEKQGGYIDNVFIERVFPNSGITTENSEFVEDDANDVEIYGGRAALRVELNDRWTVTPTIMAQETIADHVFAYQKSVTVARDVVTDLGRLKTAQRRDQGATDRWYQAALTIEGKIGSVDLTYAGSYLDRSVETVSDYADYSFFYDVLGGYTLQGDNGNNIDPSQYVLGRDHFTTHSQELRLATDQSARIRGVAGVFYQRRTDGINQNYVVDNLADALAVFPARPDNIWLTRQKRVDRDYAIFGEVAFDIIPERLTLTGGGRYYWYDNTLKGFFGYGTGISSRTGVGGCLQLAADNNQPFPEAVVPNAPCTNLLDEEIYAATGEVKPRRAEADDFLPKLNLTWKPTDDHLLYATWSKGYRPGGINRRGDVASYEPDFLTNYELGFKTSWLDNRLRVNGAVYYWEWQDVQFSFLGANGLTIIQNAGGADNTGFEIDIQAVPVDGLTLSLGGSYNDPKLTENFCVINNSPDCTLPGPAGEPNSIAAPDGQRLPITARFKGVATARYEWRMGDLDAHVQGTLSGQTNSTNSLRTGDLAVLGTRKGHELVDGSFGVSNDVWSAEIYVKNLFDAKPDLFRYTQCRPDICSDIFTFTARPRTIGLRVGRKF